MPWFNGKKGPEPSSSSTATTTATYGEDADIGSLPKEPKEDPPEYSPPAPARPPASASDIAYVVAAPIDQPMMVAVPDSSLPPNQERILIVEEPLGGALPVSATARRLRLALKRVQTAPWLYPFRGILFLTTHPSLWSVVICRLLLLLILALAFLIFMFAYVMERQHDGLRRLFELGHPGEYGSGSGSDGTLNTVAWVVSVILTLIESALAVVLFAFIFLPFVMDSLFNDVLRLRGHANVCRPTLHAGCLRVWHRLWKAESLVAIEALVLTITVPLNVIPLIGQVVYVTVNGYWHGCSFHLGYLTMKGLRFKEIVEHVRARRASYAGFGSVALALELIPMFDCLFVFTNVIGAALWAADMEDALKELGEEEATSLRGLLPPSAADRQAVIVGEFVRDTVQEHGGSINDVSQAYVRSGGNPRAVAGHLVNVIANRRT
ncbi:hypothetical protein HK101_001686 [Irineochytrium annulatum]|nr:hypothetical protein HK101_001686 [Irineochytrium annulatum]